MNEVTAFFHLNLAYSSITEEQRPLLIRRCYTPLLDLVEAGYPLGIEASAWTLRQIGELEPAWLERLRCLLKAGSCEFIGSGYVQLIGPLAPARVNRWNQELGMAAYQELLGRRPEMALVNEMAFSTGLIESYRQVGYRALAMEGNNVRLAAGSPVPASASLADGQGRSLPVLWTDSILFQKLQRYVHGESSLLEYRDYLAARADGATGVLCLYGNDAEIFDYRPGRFMTEAPLHGDGEWIKMQALYSQLSEGGYTWCPPSRATQSGPSVECFRPASAAHPIPVKKQPKYNLARWAVTGRNDLVLNTACHRRLRRLGPTPSIDKIQALCELWASDYRTHIDKDRWEEIAPVLEEAPAGASVTAPSCTEAVRYKYSHDGLVLDIDTAHLKLSLNLHRGLSIRRLAFAEQGFVPVVGTHLHGYFDCISLGADFYSANLTAEYSAEPMRITDLGPVEPRFEEDATGQRISADIDTPRGVVRKYLFIPTGSARIDIGIDASELDRQPGRVRVAAVTLLTGDISGPYWYRTHNGGEEPECFAINEDFDHARAVSPVVSCSGGVGATEGWLELGGRQQAIRVSWDPAQCAAFPMFSFRQARPSDFFRLWLSLQETDDTFRSGGKLLPLEYSLVPVAKEES